MWGSLEISGSPPPPPQPKVPLCGAWVWRPFSPSGTSQVRPMYPAGHRQWKLVTRSIQRPPLRHGWLAQSSRLTVQKRPVNPAGHRHEKRFTPSTQVAPFAQGRIKQSSMLVSQRGPVKPARHRHDSSGANPPRSSHKPPFLQGDLRYTTTEQKKLQMYPHSGSKNLENVNESKWIT